MLRKGDLAIIVKCPPQPLNIGVVVTLVEFEPYGLWLCEGNVKPAAGAKPIWNEVPYKLTLIPPSFLKPIRDPGDDAKDESLFWLPPVPNDISAEDPQDLREALKQWAEEQR